nr:PREDICTED: uncharacterized protein LOC105675264 [Linepithema humile]
MNANETNLIIKLEQMLLQYRATPHTNTKVSPAELFLGRKMRTKLDLIFPKKEVDRDTVNEAINTKEFAIGKRIACRNYTGSKKWKFGRIIERIGKLHYKIRLDDDRTWKRHANQLRGIGDRTPKLNEDNNVHGPIEEVLGDDTIPNNEIEVEQTGNEFETPASPATPPQPEHKTDRNLVDIREDIRRSARTRKPPSRYGDFLEP